MKAIAFPSFTPKASFISFPPSKVREGEREQGANIRQFFNLLPRRGRQLRTSVLPLVPALWVHLLQLWLVHGQTPCLCSPIGGICCIAPLFPCDYVHVLQRLRLAPVLANPSQRWMLMELGTAAPARLWKRPFQGHFQEACIAACCSSWAINSIWISAAAFGTFH